MTIARIVGYDFDCHRGRGGCTEYIYYKYVVYGKEYTQKDIVDSEVSYLFLTGKRIEIDYIENREIISRISKNAVQKLRKEYKDLLEKKEKKDVIDFHPYLLKVLEKK
ncbi:hypothetical protein [Chondrinema litorale]|uniref:hypothetical protein n=1 Tax=Chondrinema litorale TaxID=2994555 RepID=UPI0025426BB5|nr:hypothetical protein [Chondrinema litorale]UZR94259.1 hypothetical protein OQ292_00320 [Chondrinema litorale]